MERTLKVGVIGVGGIARLHFPGWISGPHTEIAALADVSPSALQTMGESLDVGARYTDPYELIADPDIDIVDICTPNATHLSLTLAALEAGKHVMCEKPLALAPEEIERMIAARNKSGKLLMAAQHHRFGGKARALRSEIERGALGDIYHARAWMLRRAWAGVTPDYIHKRNSGGGALIDIGVHILDLTLWMMGNPRAVAVSGITQDKLAKMPGAFSMHGGRIPEDFDVDEFAAAWVRLDNGASLILEVSWMLHHKTELEDMRIWLYGDKGGAHWPANEIMTTNYDTRQHVDSSLKLAGDDPPHAAECVAFADAVLQGGPSPVPPEQSLVVARILDGIYRSAQTGREVLLQQI